MIMLMQNFINQYQLILTIQIKIRMPISLINLVPNSIKQYQFILTIQNNKIAYQHDKSDAPLY
jgi:hypothetical protein